MDAAVSFVSAPVLEQRPMARDSFSFASMPAIARAIRPGQFVMVRLPGAARSAARPAFRPLRYRSKSFGEPIGIDMVYLVVGKMTRPAAARAEGRLARDLGTARQRLPDRRKRGPCRSRRRRHRANAVLGARPRTARYARLSAGKTYADRPNTFRSITACARPISPRASTTFAPAGAEVHLASNDGSLRPARFCHGTPRPTVRRWTTSSAAGRNRCSTRSHNKPKPARPLPRVLGNSHGVRRRDLL